jgi:hypothetical protein
MKKIKIILIIIFNILNMPHLISNLYEKSYTPFTAKLAPRNLWNRPVLGK